MKRVRGLDIPQTLEDVCDPQRMALVVYDMQVGILKQIKNPEAIVAKVSRVLDAARTAVVRTFFMRHMSLPKELMGAFCYRMAMAWQRTDDPEKVAPGSCGTHQAFRSRRSLSRGKARRSSTSSPCLRSRALHSQSRCATAPSHRWPSSASQWKLGSSRRQDTPPTSVSCPSLLRTRAAVGTSRPRNGPSNRLGSPVTPFLPMSKRSARRCRAEADERLRAIRRRRPFADRPCGPGVTQYVTPSLRVSLSASTGAPRQTGSIPNCSTCLSRLATPRTGSLQMVRFQPWRTRMPNGPTASARTLSESKAGSSTRMKATLIRLGI